MVLILLMLFRTRTVACDLCEKEQPQITRGLTHGAGPQNTVEYGIIVIAGIVVAITLFFSIKYLWKPGERDAAHIKNIIKDEL